MEQIFELLRLNPKKPNWQYIVFFFPKNEGLLWHLAEKSVNTGFVEQFWMETAEEMAAFHSRGCSIEQYSNFSDGSTPLK
jgi:hypothetical protein